MDTLSAKSALASLWPLFYAATYRSLSDDESSEIRRLSTLLEKPIAGRDGLNAGIATLHEAVKASGVLEGKRDVPVLDGLLQQIDSLREMLT